MYFWWSSNVKDYLFPGFNINSVIVFVCICFTLAVLGFALEWFKLLQSKLQQTELILRSRQLRTICPTESSTLIGEGANNSAEVTVRERLMLSLWDIIVWIFSLNVTYFVMLIVMLYNGWFMVSILAGSGVGYFIFGHSLAKINLENYRIIRETYCIYACPEAEADCSRNGESTPTTSSTGGLVERPCRSISANVS